MLELEEMVEMMCEREEAIGTQNLGDKARLNLPELSEEDRDKFMQIVCDMGMIVSHPIPESFLAGLELGRELERRNIPLSEELLDAND